MPKYSYQSSASRKRNAKLAKYATIAAAISFALIFAAFPYASSFAVPLRSFPPTPETVLAQIAQRQVTIIAIPIAATILASIIALIALLRNRRLGILPLPMLLVSLFFAAAIVRDPREFTTEGVDPNDMQINIDLSQFKSFGSQLLLIVHTSHNIPAQLGDLIEQPQGLEMLGWLNRGDRPLLDLSPDHLKKLRLNRASFDAEINDHSSYVYLGSCYSGPAPMLKWGDHVLLMYSKPYPTLPGRIVSFADNWRGWISESDFQKAYADFESRTHASQIAPPTTTISSKQ